MTTRIKPIDLNDREDRRYVGRALRSAREARRLTRIDLSQSSRIPVRIITNLEEAVEKRAGYQVLKALDDALNGPIKDALARSMPTAANIDPSTRCPVCRHLYESPKGLARHLKQSHGLGPDGKSPPPLPKEIGIGYRCLQCPPDNQPAFENRSLLLRHKREHHAHR